MKKIIIVLATMGYAMSSYAGMSFNCNKNYLGATYFATIKVDIDNTNSVFISAANNSATRRGEQSEGPVGKQSFSEVNTDGFQAKMIILEKAIPGSSYGETDFTSTSITKNEDATYSIKVKGPALKRRAFLTLGILKFENCIKK